MRKEKLFVIVGLLVAVLVIGVTGQAFAGSTTNWEMVYETDGNGQVVDGDLAVLNAAVKAGADVKVALLDVSTTDHVLTLEDIHGNADGSVWARRTVHVRWSTGEVDDLNLLYTQTFSSTGWWTGHYHGCPSEDRPANPTAGTKAMRWFVSK